MLKMLLVLALIGVGVFGFRQMGEPERPRFSALDAVKLSHPFVNVRSPENVTVFNEPVNPERVITDGRDSDHNGKDGSDPVRPINRRGIIACCGALVWGCCLLLAFRRINANRDGLTVYLYLGIGTTALVAGIVLLLLTDFRWSWGWWL